MELCYSKQSYDLEQLLALEWLDTNGLGGYASTTILGCHTRKYHGLLVSKLAKLPDKYVLLSKLDDVLVLNNKEYPLTAHQYRGALQSEVFNYFYEFALDTHPQIVYKIAEDVYLSKEILLLHEEDTILIKYKLVGNKDATIRVKPLFAYRNFHAITRENSDLNAKITKVSETVYKFSPYQGMPDFFMATMPSFAFNQNITWYRNFVYEKERQRGYEFTEDLFSPGMIELSFGDNAEVILACSLKAKNEDLLYLWNDEVRWRQDVARKLHSSPLQGQLKKAALSFLEKDEKGGSGRSIIAGYHWFLEWGRDAMISLPGLTLYSGLYSECLAVLKEFAKHEKDGLIPNFIGVKPEDNAYNSVDASLWFAWAIQQYHAKIKETKEIAVHLWPTLKNIFTHYRDGTLHNIKMQENGLLYAGSKSINLTWMDAMVQGVPVTPRYGYQVEVNALWFNMLCFIHELAILFLDPIRYDIAKLLPKIRLSFCETFYAEELGYLYDFVNEEQKNKSLRPNQIFAASLPYSPLPKKIAAKVVEKVQEHLLTPYGLRTLSPKDANYCGVYAGGQEARDFAYHNGTVWPWLLGHFAEAALKVYNKKYVVEMLKPCLAAIKSHLYEYGIGSIAEVFSADLPHQADGCISQAWSVAEILRLTYLLNAKV